MKQNRSSRDRKEKIVPVRFSNHDFSLIAKAAARKRLSVSALIRMMVMESLEKEATKKK